MLNDECASSDATSPAAAAAAAAAAADDKKLQYTLRSNPKRSRRFFDQDYTLELVPLPPAATALKKSSSIFSEKARACTECGKEFPSWKALFGHMRCHPERQWRGIQPPTSMASLGIKDRKEPKSLANTQQPPLAIMRSNDPITNSPTPSTLQSGSEIHTNDDESDTESIEAAYMNGRDPGSPVHGWMTGKRSKRSHHALRSLQAVGSGQMFEPTTPREIMDDRDMADCLVMLAFAGKSKVDDFSGSECDYAPDGKSGQQDGSESLEELDTEGNPKAEKLLAWHGGYGDDVGSARLASDVKADRYEDVGWDRKSKFECSTCKKTFRSHQALGGHRASHKKVKGCFARTNTREEGVEEVEMDMEMDANLVHGEKGKEKEEEEEDLEEVEEDLEEARMESRMHCLQCSTNCSEKTEEQDTRKKLKHQSCTSSFMAGTLLIHQQQQHPPKIHQCTICQRIFATGQALGGHKRCHWGGSGSASASEKRNYSELIKKGRQELSSCDAGAGGAVACVCATGVDDRRSLELSSKIGRHDSSSCGDGRVGAVFASAQAWLGAKGCELSKKDSRTWLGGAAEELLEKRSRLTASSTTSDSGGAAPVLEMTKKGRSDSGSLDGAAGACWFGASMFEKAMMDKNVDGCDTTQAEQLLMLEIRPPKDELLDLNLPAPLEEEEEKQHAATIPPLVPAHHSQLPSLTPATFPPPSCFSFLGPAPS